MTMSVLFNKRHIDGFFILDKPQGCSSNFALQKAKRLFNAKKAGHCGSLDPLATGVLPVCFGEATKFSQYLLDANKAYIATAFFGMKTDTGDAEGNVTERCPVNITVQDVERVIPKFTGNISQIPPMYSALKHKGKPLYRLARDGIEIARKPRDIKIHELKLNDWNTPHANFYVSCSKGTYIRTLIEDIGDALGCGAHLSMLRRVMAGPFDISQSHTLEMLEKASGMKGLEDSGDFLLPVDSALGQLPAIHVEKTSGFLLRQGQSVQTDEIPASKLVRLYDNEIFMGVGECLPSGKLTPKRLVSQQSFPVTTE